MNSKIKLIIIASLSIIIIAGAIITANSLYVPAFKVNNSIVEPIQDKWGDVNIYADPRLELLASLELNSGFYNIVPYTSQYKEDMAKHFKPLRNHKAVKLFKKISKTGIYVDAPPSMMLSLSEVPELAVKYDFSQSAIDGFTKNVEATDAFLQEYRSYAEVSGIQEFFEKHKEFYTSNINKVKEILKKKDYVKDIESYYGYGQKSYNIILSPLFEGNFGPKIETEEGSHLYAIIGGSDIKDEMDEDMLRYLIWHEFSHSFINPLSQKPENKAWLEGYSDNYSSISEKMKRQGYGEWINSVNEHVIRAVTIRLTDLCYGEAAANELLENEKKKGFVYVEELCQKLEVYEKNRESYKTIDEFYPELIKVFEKKYE